MFTDQQNEARGARIVKVEKNKVVSLDFTLWDAEGEVIDSSEGGEPLEYLHGHLNLVPGLEKALDGKVVGDSFKITVPAAEAFGERDEDLVQVLPRSDFPEELELMPGMQFEAEDEDGNTIVTITAVDGEEITVDSNPEFAGMDLTYEVKVVEIREATEEEIEHGHVHGEGCGHELFEDDDDFDDEDEDEGR